MNKKENLLITLSEECTEILQDIENNISISTEINDLFAVYEMLVEFEYLEEEEVDLLEDTSTLNDKNLKLEFLKLQYFISKALRFGLIHKHPKTGRTNMLEILTCFNKIKNTTIEYFNQEKIDQKKLKVDKFAAVSVEIGTLEI